MTNSEMVPFLKVHPTEARDTIAKSFTDIFGEIPVFMPHPGPEFPLLVKEFYWRHIGGRSVLYVKLVCQQGEDAVFWRPASELPFTSMLSFINEMCGD